MRREGLVPLHMHGDRCDAAAAAAAAAAAEAEAEEAAPEIVFLVPKSQVFTHV